MDYVLSFTKNRDQPQNRQVCLTMPYPDSLVGYDDDKDMAVATRNRVLDMVATDGLLVSGFHMPYPSLGYVERTQDSYRWTPASYQTQM
jgi:hypothetical protein